MAEVGSVEDSLAGLGNQILQLSIPGGLEKDANRVSVFLHSVLQMVLPLQQEVQKTNMQTQCKN